MGVYQWRHRAQKPIIISNRVNPIVAPETNGRVLLNPWLAPDDIMTILTGPGEMDMVRENKNIAKNKVILSPYSYRRL